MKPESLHNALLQIAPASNATEAEKRTAWGLIHGALNEHWFASLPLRYGATPDVVDDVRQTVVVKLLSGRAVFVGKSEGEAVNFLKATARNATVDTLRRRKFEEPLSDEQVEQTAGGVLPDEQLHANEVSRRLLQVVDRATTLARSPTRAMLERHLSETLFGQAPADRSLDADQAAAARLRKERSRSLALLRRAHATLIGEMAQEMNDDVDRIVREILSTPRNVTSEEAE